MDDGVIDQVLKTVVAIANNGKDRTGTILIGVSDKPADVERVKKLDSITPKQIGSTRVVVGINREAVALDETVETYVARWKAAIANSQLSEPLRASILSSITYNDFYGLGVLILRVPPQQSLSFYGEDVYWRKSDETTKAAGNKEVANLAQRF